MHDILAAKLFEMLERIEEQNEVKIRLLRDIRRNTAFPYRVLGGVMTQIGDPTMIPIQPGQSPKFQVTPTFSGAPFALDGSKAAISTSDSVNAPASIDLTDDPTGATFVLNLTAGAVIGAGGEAITVDWSYTNLDGVVAHVTGTVTEEGIVDDVTGGTFAQVA